MIQIAIVKADKLKSSSKAFRIFFDKKIERMIIALIPFTVENPCFRAVVLMT